MVNLGSSNDECEEELREVVGQVERLISAADRTEVVLAASAHRLNAYTDAGTPMYYVLTRRQVRTLADGRIPPAE